MDDRGPPPRRTGGAGGAVPSPRGRDPRLRAGDGLTVEDDDHLKGARRGFAGGRPTRRGVQDYLDLTRGLVGDPRILGSTPDTARLHVNRYRLSSPAELDDTFLGWLHEAYRVGHGEHLR